MSKIAKNSTDTIDSFTDTINTFNSDAVEMAALSSDVASATFMILAKIDHVLFKSNAYVSVFHGHKKQEFGDHHSCRLGKWYETGLGKEIFSMMPSYKLMMEPHKIVHDRIRDNMTFIEPVDRVLENQEKLKQNFI